MKLFLASAFDQSLSSFKKIFGSEKNRKVIFIANAADNDKGNKWWIKNDRDAFLKLGCNPIDVDLRKITKKDFSKLLKEADIIHFCGGSVIYLICIIKERGFVKLITDAVRKSKIIYTGTSAGSMIVAEDLTIDAYDPDEKEFVARMKDNSGLGLTNFLIIPHTNSKDFAKGNSKMVSELPEIDSKQPLIFIYDGQAVLVDNKGIKII
jgi:dipeptidase E